MDTVGRKNCESSLNGNLHKAPVFLMSLPDKDHQVSEPRLSQAELKNGHDVDNRAGRMAKNQQGKPIIQRKTGLESLK